MPKPSVQPPTFEEAVTELETLVASLESGQLSLEQSIAAYQRGTELLKLCQKSLADAEQQVKILSADGSLKDFQVDA